MDDVKFGIGQAQNPPPPFLTRALHAAVFLFGAAGLYVSQIPASVMSDHTKVSVGSMAGLGLIFIQALCVLFGVEVKKPTDGNATN